MHGTSVADGRAGAEVQKPLGIQKCDGPTETARCRVACQQLKRVKIVIDTFGNKAKRCPIDTSSLDVRYSDTNYQDIKT